MPKQSPLTDLIAWPRLRKFFSKLPKSGDQLMLRMFFDMWKQLLVLVWIGGLLAGRCGSPAPADESYTPGAEWRRRPPRKSQGMDSTTLVKLLEEIQQKGHAIDSLTIMRNGYLVLDATVYPFRQGDKHIVHSCTKSIVSILIGIAIEQDYIESVDTPLLSFFPQYAPVKNADQKQAITLEHLLKMATGLDCRDSYLYRWEGLERMRASPDWVQYMLDLPVVEPPDTRFEYCNGASFLLSAIIQQTTGQGALEYAQENLFGPLGITDVEWPANPQGIQIGWGELRMRPQDMARIGYLYLNHGRWGEEQIVPAEWVAASTRKYLPATLEDGYGYQWWVMEDGIYLALGYAGQFIYVVPKLNLVVVYTSHLAESDFYIPQTLLLDSIIPAVRSTQPLSDNPDAVNQLAARLADLASS